MRDFPLASTQCLWLQVIPNHQLPNGTMQGTMDKQELINGHNEQLILMAIRMPSSLQ